MKPLGQQHPKSAADLAFGASCSVSYNAGRLVFAPYETYWPGATSQAVAFWDTQGASAEGLRQMARGG